MDFRSCIKSRIVSSGGAVDVSGVEAQCFVARELVNNTINF
jgi:hypothetical protein